MIAVGAFALCCGGPLLLAAALTAGLGAWALEHGPTLLGGGLLVLAAIAASVVLLRGRGERVVAEDECCAPFQRANSTGVHS